MLSRAHLPSIFTGQLIFFTGQVVVDDLGEFWWVDSRYSIENMGRLMVIH
jgi:hypothetical protein